MFKQFFLTIIFGVIHGLVFLPIMLVYFGPPEENVAVGGSTSKITPLGGGAGDNDIEMINKP